MNDDQIMEWEVLESIYSIDENYKKVADNRLQYKIGCDTDRTFLIELQWPQDYPTMPLNINLNVFYNSHIAERSREFIRQKLMVVAKDNEGMASSFTVIEYAKENCDSLTSEWELASSSDAIGEVIASEEKEKKDIPLTKSAKRRMWDRNEGTGKERGWDWIDILKHLAQTRDT